LAQASLKKHGRFECPSMAWRAYRWALQAHPFKTKALTTSGITGLSDVLLQFYEKGSSQEDRCLLGMQGATVVQNAVDMQGASVPSFRLPDVEWSRTLTLAAVGFFYSGPVNHIWFATLEKFVRTQNHMRSVSLKLMIDQALFVPSAISGYMIVRGFFEQKTLPQIHQQLEEKLSVATQAAWQFWPMVNIVSFSLVPLMYRVLFGNVCALFWNAKLSFISSQPTEGVMAQYVEKLVNVEGSDEAVIYDEALPSLGFDEAWAVGSAANSLDIFGMGFDEKLPTTNFDEAWSLAAASSDDVYTIGFDETLPTSGFDEAWAVGSVA